MTISSLELNYTKHKLNKRSEKEKTWNRCSLLDVNQEILGFTYTLY